MHVLSHVRLLARGCTSKNEVPFLMHISQMLLSCTYDLRSTTLCCPR